MHVHEWSFTINVKFVCINLKMSNIRIYKHYKKCVKLEEPVGTLRLSLTIKWFIYDSQDTSIENKKIKNKIVKFTIFRNKGKVSPCRKSQISLDALVYSNILSY